MTFEEQFEQLEEILGRLERGDVSLDESLVEYEKGIRTVASCREMLAAAEKKIEELGPPSPASDPEPT